MFPRFPKARPWAARSPKAVTSDRFSLSDNKEIFFNKQTRLKKPFIDFYLQIKFFLFIYF